MEFLKQLGLEAFNIGTSTGLNWLGNDKSEIIESYSPVDGNLIGKATVTTRAEYETVMATAKTAFKTWAKMPAPKRGEIVRQYGDVLRQNKAALGQLVSYEMGKSLQEGYGEVQE
jgi:aldehyde dehydrogenase (NAD+)